MAAQRASADKTDAKRNFARLQRVKQQSIRRRQIVDDDIERKQERIKRKQEEIKRLQIDIVHLKTKRKMIGGQYNDYVNDAKNPTIILYSKAWNLKFAEKMQTSLPRELRELVYGFVWDADEWRQRKETFIPTLGACCCTAVPSYVGQTTAREMADVIYKNFSTVDFQFTVAQPENIKTILCNDVFHVGLDPSYYLRSLSVECKIDRFRMPRPCRKESDRCQHGPAQKQHIMQQRVKSLFSPILEIKRKERFKLHISLIHRNIRLSVLKEFLETIKDAVLAIREAGGTVTIQWWFNDFEDAWLDDIEEYYDTPIEAWHTHVINDLHERHNDRLIPRRQARFLNEPGLKLDENGQWTDEPRAVLSDRDFVHAMWDASENEATTSAAEDANESDSDSDDGFWQ